MLDIVQVDVYPKKYIRTLHVNVYRKWYVRGSINTPSQQKMKSSGHGRKEGRESSRVVMKVKLTAQRMGRLVGTGQIGWNVYKRSHESSMFCNRKGLCREISQIVRSFEPCDYKLVLTNSISYPVELHVNTFCAARGDSVVGNADSTGIVAENGCGRLSIAQTGEDIAQHSTLASCYEEGCVFGYSDRGDDERDDGTDGMTRTIGGSGRRNEVEETAGYRSGVRTR